MHGRERFSKVGLPLWGGLAPLLLVAGSATAQDGDWPMYNHDPSGSRFNDTENKLGVSNIGKAEVLWNFQIPDASVSGTPVVVDGTVYVGDSAGRVWAVSAPKGKAIWHTQLTGQITASALVTDKLVIIGVLGNFVDSGANLYGLDRKTGEIEWKTVLDPHPLSAIYGSATTVGKYVAVGVASNEENATTDASYPCCTTRGSLALVDPKDGAIVWQTYTLPPASSHSGAGGTVFGPSGASIWSTPSFDDQLNLIYATTGNNFSEPTSETSDAIIAFDATTGAIKWSNQRTKDDLWNFQFPLSDEHPDFDFGDSAQVYTLSNGRKVVGAGQKSGFYHVLDAATGEEVIPPVQPVPGGVLGGLFADTAVANGVIFANGVEWNPFDPSSGAPLGHLIALSADTLEEEWHVYTPFSPNLSGVAVANGVVYFQSLFDGNLYALNAATGDELLRVPVGASLSGPAVSNGCVYVGTGDAIFRPALGGTPALPGGIIAIGLR